MKRIDALKQKAFKEGEFDGFLVFNSANLIYLTGFSGASALLTLKNGESRIYVYSVNHAHAKAELPEIRIEVVKHKEKLMAEIAKKAKALAIKRLAVDSLNVESWRTITKFIGKEKMLDVDESILRAFRMVKDENEIELMHKAAELTSEGMRIAREVVVSGMKEYEVAAEIEYAMRKKALLALLSKRL